MCCSYKLNTTTHPFGLLKAVCVVSLENVEKLLSCRIVIVFTVTRASHGFARSRGQSSHFRYFPLHHRSYRCSKRILFGHIRSFLAVSYVYPVFFPSNPLHKIGVPSLNRKRPTPSGAFITSVWAIGHREVISRLYRSNDVNLRRTGGV